MTKIFYNSIDAFQNIAPTPFVGRQMQMINYGDNRWAEVETFTLKGQIVNNCPNNISDLVAKQQSLLSNFSRDFQTFEVHDTVQGVIFSRPLVRVEDIRFDQSNYSVVIPFTITLQAYPADFFEGQYGVLEPREEFNYSEDANGILTITHSISARGINTNKDSSNALENARAWVQSKTGLGAVVLPLFIQYTPNSPCLTSRNEVIDRMAATYQIREVYTTDLILGGSSILRYTCEFSVNDTDGRSTMQVRGTIEGCKNGTIDDVVARYNQFNALGEAQNQFFKITGRADLNPIPISQGVTQDDNNRQIGFSYVYNDDVVAKTTFDYKVSFSYDYENDLITASIDGTVKSRVLPLSARWGAVKDFAGGINLLSLLTPLYQSYAGTIGVSYPLNPIPRRESRTENQYNNEIGLSASYDNSQIPPSGLRTWDYTITGNPPLRQYSIVPCLGKKGKYIAFDLGFVARGSVAVQAKGTSLDGNPDSQVIGLVNTIAQQAVGSGQEQHTDSYKVTDSNVSFGTTTVSKTISYLGPEFTI